MRTGTSRTVLSERLLFVALAVADGFALIDIPKLSSENSVGARVSADALRRVADALPSRSRIRNGGNKGWFIAFGGLNTPLAESRRRSR